MRICCWPAAAIASPCQQSGSSRVTGVRIAKALRDQITAEAGQRCGYCLTPQEHTAMPMEIEHMIPRAIGRPTTQDSLWLACPLCNGHKATQTHGTDPLSGDRTPIFNPRKQIWGEHFAWSQDGTRIVGLSACGRTTIAALQLNNEYLVKARRRWVMAGWHPPQE